MIERDYIMRMISLLTQVLAQILFRKKAKEFPEALLEINNAGRKLIGTDINLLHALPEEQILDLFGSDRAIEIPKCYLAGKLLKEEAEIYDLQGRHDESLPLYYKALYLLLEVAAYSDIALIENLPADIQELIVNLRDYEKSVSLLNKLTIFYEKTCQFDKAEDILFELIELDNTMLSQAENFYHRLLQKPDEELIKGNLPRNEVKSGLAELQAKQRSPFPSA
jgi:hypothetical protein